MLIFAGKPLLDENGSTEMTVGDYGIQKNSTLMLGLRLKGGSTKLELVVKLANDEEIKLDISNTATVKQFKEAIYARK